MMKRRHALPVVMLLPLLAACSPQTQSTAEESAQHIANRAADISAAADDAVNQQIAEIEAAATAADAAANQQ
jgi:5,10-methylenetetrahydrofolate reductase